MNNEELINEYENISIAYIKVSREIVERQLKKEMSYSENRKIIEITKTTKSSIFHFGSLSELIVSK